MSEHKDSLIKGASNAYDFLANNRDKWGGSLAPGVIVLDIHDVARVDSKIKKGRQVVTMTDGLDLWSDDEYINPDVSVDEAMDWLKGL